ncbi:MAG: hypothetical protein RR637_09665 [Clostridium sp.]
MRSNDLIWRDFKLDLYNNSIRKAVDMQYDVRLVGFGELNLMTNRG